MAITVKGPDGATINFPDGTDTATMTAAMRRHYGGPAAPAPRPQSGVERARADYERSAGALGDADDPTGLKRRAGEAAIFNLGGELTGATTAATVAAANLIRRAMGKQIPYTAAEAYKGAEEGYDARLARTRAEHPVLSVGADLGGSLVAPGMLRAGKWAAAGKNLPALMLRGAAVGAGAGAAYGAGADTQDRLRGAVGGGVTGAALGAFAPPAVGLAAKGLEKVARPAARAVAPLINLALAKAGRPEVHVASTPELRAATALQGALERDAQGDHVADLALPLRHSGGENTAALFDVVANSPGPGLAIVRKAIEKTRDAAKASIRNDLAETMGGDGGYLDRLDAAKAARAEHGGPAFEAAFDEPLAYDTFVNKVAPVLRRIPRSFITKARQIAQMDDRDPFEPGWSMVDEFAGHDVATGDLPTGKIGAWDLRAVQRGTGTSLGRGDSLMRFLSRIGLAEDPELVARDAGLWHRGKAGMRKLIQPNGISLEEAAQRAHQAGYFPEKLGLEGADNYHPVTPEDLLAALDDEAGGRATRFLRDPDPKALARISRRDELEAKLRNAGVDINALDQEGAARALAEHEADLYRLEAHANGEPVGMSENVQARTESPRLRHLHDVKRAVDARLNELRNEYGVLDLEGNPEAQALVGARQALGQTLRDVSPRYDAAARKWGVDSDLIDAGELGRNAFSGQKGIHSHGLAKAVSKMSPPEFEEYRRGVSEAVLDLLRNKGDIATVRRLVGDKGDEMRARLATAFTDPAQLEGFLGRLQVHAENAARDNRIANGSPTAFRQAARADLDEQGGGAIGVLSDIVSLNPKLMAGRVLRRALKALPKGAGSALKDPAANRSLGRAASDPAEVQRLLGLLSARNRMLLAPARATAGSAAVLDHQRP